MSSSAAPLPDQQAQTAVWLIGASTRSLAQAAHRSGFHVTSSDLFADLETRQCGPCLPIATYPDDILEHAHHISPRPVVYTGGLENYPDLLRTLSHTHPLWGCCPQVLEIIRDPFRLSTELERYDLRMPPIRRQLPRDAAARDWLLKPLRGAGGLGIQRAATADNQTAERQAYFQRWQSGEPHAAAWLIAETGCQLLGWTRQLVGVWPLIAETTYCGSVGPLAIPERLQLPLTRLGQLLWETGVRGLAGVDVLVEDDELWILEVNPRPTQSMELIQPPGAANLFARHAAVFGHVAFNEHPGKADVKGWLPQRRSTGPSATSLAPGARPAPGGKLIVYAPADIPITGDLREFTHDRLVGGSITPNIPASTRPVRHRSTESSSRFWFADMPAPGQTVGAGHPLCTLLWQPGADARASIADGCELLSRFTGVTISPPRLPASLVFLEGAGPAD